MAEDPAWVRDLQLGSFAGVPFRVFGHGRSGGVRGPDRNYPQRDLGSVGNQGRRLHGFTFDAFVIGDDYHEQTTRLIEALEAGSAELVHPRWGPRQAICRDYQEAETHTEGGIARLSLVFVEDPQRTGLVITLASTLDVRGDAAKDVAADALDEDLDATGSGAVADDALATASEALARVRSAVQGPLVGALANAEAASGFLNVSAATLLSPTELATWGRGLFEAIGDFSALDAFTRFRPTVRATTSTDANELRLATNANAINGYLQRVALAEQAQAGATLATDTLEVYDDALAVRDALAERIAFEEGLGLGSAEHLALVELRTAVFAEITDAAEPLVRLREITLDDVTSTLELAWALYGDAEREAEIAERNGVRHRGFMPPGVYTVLVA